MSAKTGLRSVLFKIIEPAMFNYPDEDYINKALDKLEEVLTKQQTRQEVLLELAKKLPKGCGWCDFRGYTEGVSATDNSRKITEPCDFCTELLSEVRAIINTLKREI